MYHANNPGIPAMTNDQAGRKRDAPEDNPMITHERPPKVMRPENFYDFFQDVTGKHQPSISEPTTNQEVVQTNPNNSSDTSTLEYDGLAALTFGNHGSPSFGIDESATFGSNNTNNDNIGSNSPSIDVNAAVFGNHDLLNVGRQLDPVVLGNNHDSLRTTLGNDSSAAATLENDRFLAALADESFLASYENVTPESFGYPSSAELSQNLGSASFEQLASASVEHFGVPSLNENNNLAPLPPVQHFGVPYSSYENINLSPLPPVEHYASALSHGQQLATYGDVGSASHENVGSSTNGQQLASDTHGQLAENQRSSSFRQPITTESCGHHLGSSNFENVVSSSPNARNLGSVMTENLGSSSFANVVSSSVEHFGYGTGEAWRSTAKAYFHDNMDHFYTYWNNVRKRKR